MNVKQGVSYPNPSAEAAYGRDELNVSKRGDQRSDFGGGPLDCVLATAKILPRE